MKNLTGACTSCGRSENVTGSYRHARPFQCCCKTATGENTENGIT